MIDIVNDKDEIVGKIAERDLYVKNPTHRIVHILIFNSDGKMLIQLRSDKKPYCPGCWSTSAGGHVNSGETTEQAAKRELKEELGIAPKLKFIAKDYYVSQDRIGVNNFIYIYRATYNGPFDLGKDEVEKIEFFQMAKIKKMIKAGEKFHPELKFIINKNII